LVEEPGHIDRLLETDGNQCDAGWVMHLRQKDRNECKTARQHISLQVDPECDPTITPTRSDESPSLRI